MTEVMKFVQSSERVLVTGGTGSLGVALTERLLVSGARVRVFARDEKKQYDMRREFPDAEYLIGDIRDPATVRDAVRDVDVVIHGASLKYVNIGEVQPLEYVQTNINGTINLVEAILAEGTVRRCVGISSDKACQPVNVYGMTKAVLERLMLEATRRQGEKGETIFNVARYGNVLGTRGSVVPFWRQRVADGLPLPITDPEMTRFFFTIQEATDLIDICLETKENVIISKLMNACTLGDLADVMKRTSPVEIVGPRPGEKKHEQLLSSDEMERTVLVGKFFFFEPEGERLNVSSTAWGLEGFTSANAPRLDLDEIRNLLKESDL